MIDEKKEFIKQIKNIIKMLQNLYIPDDIEESIEQIEGAIVYLDCAIQKAKENNND